MIVFIDNYDSFAYNLVQYIGAMGAEVRVFRNDAVLPDEIASLGPEGVVVSPGPRTPKEAGVSVEAVRAFAGKVPVLGVCLGCQSIAAAFGGRVVKAKRLMHGKTSKVTHDGKGVLKGLPNPLEGGRYHSLAVEEESLPKELEVTARAADGEIMGIRHRTACVEGVQFHPESILTPCGMDLMRNFLEMTVHHGGTETRRQR